MKKFVSNPENLKQQMNLLKDKSPNIQFEAFHVFKVCFDLFVSFRFDFSFSRQIFVVNPNKSFSICKILRRNKEKLIEFLSNFHDDQLNDEKSFLIEQIRDV